MRRSPQASAASVVVRCRTCGRVAYKRGPCPTCRVFGHPWEPTDVVEIHLHGTVPGLRRELARWKKEALALREVYRDAMAEADRLRRVAHRAETVARRMEAWERWIARCRVWLVRG